VAALLVHGAEEVQGGCVVGVLFQQGLVDAGGVGVTAGLV
jgi:hypothetical protein